MGRQDGVVELGFQPAPSLGRSVVGDWYIFSRRSLVPMFLLLNRAPFAHTSL